MPYNPNLYNPYGLQQQAFQPVLQQPQVQQQVFQQQQQQPYNGIIQVADENEAIQRSNLMPPNSVSHPYFLPDGQTYVVVFKDSNNSATTRRYHYEDVTPDPMAIYVTKEDFAVAINDIKEAINGKSITASAATPGATVAG